MTAGPVSSRLIRNTGREIQSVLVVLEDTL